MEHSSAAHAGERSLCGLMDSAMIRALIVTAPAAVGFIVTDFALGSGDHGYGDCWVDLGDHGAHVRL